MNKIMGTGQFNAGVYFCNIWTSISHGGGELEMLLITSCDTATNNYKPDGPLGSYADFTSIFVVMLNVCLGIFAELTETTSKSLPSSIKFTFKTSLFSWASKNPC